MTEQPDPDRAERAILPDLVRAFALVGIALVNVQYLAWPAMTGYPEAAFATVLDTAAYFGVNALFLFKSYTLFAFMFGAGFAYQIVSAERRHASFAAEYWRRIVGLAVLGLAHVALLFQGDILFIYAILGALLFLFRKAGTRTLVRWAVAVYALQVVIVAMLAVFAWLGATMAPEVMAAEAAALRNEADRAMDAFGAGGFAEAAALRLSEWSGIVLFGLLAQGPGAFAFFLFGLAAVRGGAIADPGAPIWRRSRRIFLPIGLAGSAVGAWVMGQAGTMVDPEMLIGLALITLFGAFASAGYIGLIALWAKAPPSASKTFLARGGTATLTAYLTQSLIFSLIFNAYGLGLFGSLGVAACTALAFLVALASIGFASLWRARFARGPMEVLLRRWTYLGTR